MPIWADLNDRGGGATEKLHSLLFKAFEAGFSREPDDDEKSCIMDWANSVSEATNVYEELFSGTIEIETMRSCEECEDITFVLHRRKRNPAGDFKVVLRRLSKRFEPEEIAKLDNYFSANGISATMIGMMEKEYVKITKISRCTNCHHGRVYFNSTQAGIDAVNNHR